VQLGSHGVAATAFGRGWDVLNGQWAEADYGLANGDGVSTGDNMVGYFVEFTPGSVADVNDNAPELARSVSSVIVTKAIAPTPSRTAPKTTLYGVVFQKLKGAPAYVGTAIAARVESGVAITATWWRTRSAAISGRRSSCPSAQPCQNLRFMSPKTRRNWLRLPNCKIPSGGPVAPSSGPEAKPHPRRRPPPFRAIHVLVGIRSSFAVRI
jgi:hypothetical protein